MDEGLTIQEAAERVGLSVDTLRYYERAGLLSPILRTTGGQRRFDGADLNVISFVTKLRATGMPIRRIRQYMEASVRPDGSSPERRAILVEHRQSVLDKLRELNEAMELIDRKINRYDSDGVGYRPENPSRISTIQMKERQ